jgi:hypothetical protein
MVVKGILSVFLRAKDLFMQWANLRRLYTYFMTLNQRRLLSRHREFLFSEKAQQKCGAFKEKEVFCATSLIDVDENYSRCVVLTIEVWQYFHVTVVLHLHIF